MHHGKAIRNGEPSGLRSATNTGDVWSDILLNAGNARAINIMFPPGARTHWHAHERGQLLFVVAGYGLICTAGQAPAPLRAGDWVWIPPGERHWHGASPTTFLTHTAISLGATQWADEVSADDYASTPHPFEGQPE